MLSSVEDERDLRIIAKREEHPLLRGAELRDALEREHKEAGLL
jgi:hypothetical protein